MEYFIFLQYGEIESNTENMNMSIYKPHDSKLNFNGSILKKKKKQYPKIVESLKSTCAFENSSIFLDEKRPKVKSSNFSSWRLSDFSPILRTHKYLHTHTPSNVYTESSHNARPESPSADLRLLLAKA